MEVLVSQTPTLDLARQRWTQREIADLLGVTHRTIIRWESGETPMPENAMVMLADRLSVAPTNGHFRFIDLFAGIGGTRLGWESVGGQCVFTSEWDKFAKRTYIENFGEQVGHVFTGDITQVNAEEIPDHEVLVAGFPCQPFSIAGVSKKNALGRPHGFADETQGTLFFDVARIIDAKRPKAFMLENVRNLMSHDRGMTFKIIMRTLQEELGYQVHARVLNASALVPQGRQRIFIVGFDRDTNFDFEDLQLPATRPTMKSILHPQDGSEPAETPYTKGKKAKVDEKYVLTDHLWSYLQGYAAKHRSAGNGFGYGLVGKDDVARTLSARYYKDGSEILIDRGRGRNPRRLTPRECARLMGFPDTFRIPVSDTQAYKQFGNSVVVPVISAVATHVHSHLGLEPIVESIAPVSKLRHSSSSLSAVAAHRATA
jgi:DNA (cytosine-5)-methyltransferase 1